MADLDKIITIDGTAASGKGAIARRLANHYNYAYLDTGKLYRAIAYLFLKDGIKENYQSHAANYAQKINESLIANPELLSENVGKLASETAAIPEIRKALKQFQYSFIEKNQGVVLDGRDTGSVICPEAKYKFYVDADPKIRARRRVAQLEENGVAVNYEEILSDIVARDKRDKEREISPLVIPQGAIEIDNSKDSIDEIVRKIIEILTISE